MIGELGLRGLGEYAQLRDEAVELLDLCLTEGDGGLLLSFVDRQIAHDPPRILLLHALSDDLQLRLLSLREYRFDVRDRIVRLFRDDFGVDITGVVSPDALDQYHHTSPQAFLDCIAQQGRDDITAQEQLLLGKAVEVSLEIAAQLTADIRLAEQLQSYVLDWLSALNALRAAGHPPGSSASNRNYVQ